jgi:hypothetical protein
MITDAQLREAYDTLVQSPPKHPTLESLDAHAAQLTEILLMLISYTDYLHDKIRDTLYDVRYLEKRLAKLEQR